MHSYIHRSYLDLDTYTNTYLHACTASYIPAYPRRYINTHTHVHLPTYLLSYLHTYIQTDIHTLLPSPHCHIPPPQGEEMNTCIHTYLQTHFCPPPPPHTPPQGGWCGGERGLERLAHIYIYIIWMIWYCTEISSGYWKRCFAAGL